MTAIALIRAYWKPLAVFLLLLAVWLHGNHAGTSGERTKWELITARDAAKSAKISAEAERKARKQEHDWSAAFDLTANMYQESYSELEKKRDRIMRDVAAGRLRVPSACPRLPEAPAHPGQPQESQDSGQPDLAGDLVQRLAVCDEVTIERNMAVKLMEDERREMSSNP